MELSLVGIAVCFALYVMARRTADPLVTAMLWSTVFGSTAAVTISALGGASPPVFVVFLGAIVVSSLGRRGLAQELREVLQSDWLGWTMLALLVYSLAGSIIMPRLFLNEMTVFQVSRISGAVEGMLLQPVSHNVTQAVYFSAGILAYFAVRLRLRGPADFEAISVGMTGAACLNMLFALIDIGGKLAGLGDLLAVFRTASYSMISQDIVVGFFRIAANFPEASAFAGATVPLLVFTVIIWRNTGNVLAGFLSLVQLGLLLLSTSSGAYVILSVLAIVWLLGAAASALQRRVMARDLAIALLGLLGLTSFIVLSIYDGRLLDPFRDLIQEMVFNKSTSMSAVERGIWNTASLDALWDTGGLGIGIGSSRTSSLLVAVLSHLGIPGAVMMLSLLFFLLRGLRGVNTALISANVLNVCSGVRAAGLAALLPASLGSPSADPGLLFFVAIALVAAVRQRALNKKFGTSFGRARRGPSIPVATKQP